MSTESLSAHAGLPDQAALKALELLRSNLTPDGFMAASRTASAAARRYTCVFARDAAVCSLAAAATGDPVLLGGARASLRLLAAHQADNGQIPKYVDPETRTPDFWYVGCIDATLWWLIALHFLSNRHPDRDLAVELQPAAERALLWLRCQEHPRLCLIQQNEASDWADIMPRSGFVLYSNALWYYVKRLYRQPHAERTRHHFNHLFFPFAGELPDYHRLRLLGDYARDRAANRDLYLSFVNLSFWGEEGDVFGNLLALLCGLADEGMSERVIDALQRAGVDAIAPVRAVVTPISRQHALWRGYMDRHQQNGEFQYHNGGIWPFIGGFWVITLARSGRKAAAGAALERLAQTLAAGDWSFHEWFDGRSGAARGMTGQSWNAAMFLLARQELEQPLFGRSEE